MQKCSVALRVHWSYEHEKHLMKLNGQQGIFARACLLGGASAMHKFMLRGGGRSGGCCSTVVVTFGELGGTFGCKRSRIPFISSIKNQSISDPSLSGLGIVLNFSVLKIHHETLNLRTPTSPSRREHLLIEFICDPRASPTLRQEKQQELSFCCILMQFIAEI